MSKALDMADLIRTRLLSAPAVGELATPVDITGLEVIVYRQKELASRINTAIAKVTGTAIVIVWNGFRVMDGNAKRPRLAQSYNITVWSRPILNDGGTLAADVMESILLRLWHWVPLAGHASGEAEVTDGGIVPDKSYLKIDCEVTIPTNL